MLYWIRTFLILFRVAAFSLAVTLMPSNVSAMVQCDGHEAPIAHALDQTDQTMNHAVDHVTDHCGAHICVLGDLCTADAETPRSVRVATRSWDMASLVVTAIPEGLQRPPRA